MLKQITVWGNRCNYSPRAPMKPIDAIAYGQLSLNIGVHESMATYEIDLGTF